jgi:DNA repair exonuclease SbcCD nuclease subunit
VGYTFTRGRDVVAWNDLPPEFDAVLAGHIHRHQILNRRARENGGPVVVYPGSTERTSFAEADEAKGYCRMVFDSGTGGEWRLDATEFVPLPSRPMLTVRLPDRLTPAGVGSFLSGVARQAAPDAILRFTCSDELLSSTRRAFTSSALAKHLPASMNVQFGSGFFGRKRSGRVTSRPRMQPRGSSRDRELTR